MDEALWTLLTGSSAVTALCGGRIFWGIAPQGTALPALVLNLVSAADTPHLGGTDGLWRYRVQIDCFAVDRPAARALSRAVLELLNGYAAPGGAGLSGVFIDGTREATEEAGSGRPSRISHDFIILWRD